MSIPFIDLKSQFARLEPEIRRRMDAVLAHGRYIMGPEIEELEEKLAAFAGTRFCLSCSSGTDALLLPLMALGVGPGDAVLTSAYSFYATAEVIALLGATPVFVDIDPATYNLDPAALERAIHALLRNDPSLHPLPKGYESLTPRAIIPVDLFGLPADYAAIEAVASAHGLPIIEDAAQGFGGAVNGRRAGSFGLCAATSFFPAKPLGCYGDGGAIFTDDEALHEKLVSLRVHGQGSDKYENVAVGLNARLDTLQAAILLPKLEIFPEELELRQVAAARYTERLSGLVETPVIPDGYFSAYAQYTVRTDRREQLMSGLSASGVPTMVYYRIPLHLQPVFAHLGYGEGDMPHSEKASREVVSLPMHPWLTEADAEAIGNAVRAVLW